MRKILLIFLLLLAPFVSHAEDLYVAQSSAGDDSGSSCANAKAASWFNTAGSWGAGANKISAGDNVHLCGTITTTLTAQDSGEVGNPITITFEADAKLSQAYCPELTGCFNTNSKTNLTIDGGSNGIIESTANGSALANQQFSRGISAIGCDNCEIANLHIHNIYQHTLNTDITLDGSQLCGIKFSGSNVKIHNNTIHDTGWAVNYAYGADSGTEIYNNDISRVDHGVAVGGYGEGNISSNVRIYNNYIYDYSNWDTSANKYHHDGIHAYATPPAKCTSIYIYNNRLTGDVGGNMTSQIFLEESGSGTPWGDNTSTAYIYNNVLIANADLPTGIMGVGTGTDHVVYGNTIIGAGAAAEGSCLGASVGTNIKIKNNFIAGCNKLIYASPGGTLPAGFELDYNVYANCSSYNCFWVEDTDTGSFATYRAAQPTLDANSIDLTGSSTGGLNADGTIPDAAYLGIDNGVTLGAPYNVDRLGVSRPQGAAYDIGAYEGATEDTTPTTFTFTDVTGASLTTQYTSDNITVLGIDSATTLVLTGAGCEYSINGAAWATTNDNVSLNDNVALRTTSSGSYNTGITCTVTIGGVSDEWTVTTAAAADPEAVPHPPRFRGSGRGRWK